MHTIIRIDMDNAAFEDSPEMELRRALRNLADSLDYLHWPFVKDFGQAITDSNGNSVGRLEIVED